MLELKGDWGWGGRGEGIRLRYKGTRNNPKYPKAIRYTAGVRTEPHYHPLDHALSCPPHQKVYLRTRWGGEAGARAQTSS